MRTITTTTTNRHFGFDQGRVIVRNGGQVRTLALSHSHPAWHLASVLSALALSGRFWTVADAAGKAKRLYDSVKRRAVVMCCPWRAVHPAPLVPRASVPTA